MAPRVCSTARPLKPRVADAWPRCSRKALSPIGLGGHSRATSPSKRPSLGSVVRKQRCQNFWGPLQVYGDHQTESLKSDTFPESPSWRIRGIWVVAVNRAPCLLQGCLIPQAGKAACAGPLKCLPLGSGVSQPLIRPLS